MYCQQPGFLVLILSCADPGIPAETGCEVGPLGGGAEFGAVLRSTHGLPHLPPPRLLVLVPFCPSLPDQTHVQPGLHPRTAGVCSSEWEGRVIRTTSFLGGEEVVLGVVL